MRVSMDRGVFSGAARLAALAGALVIFSSANASAQCAGDCNGDGSVAINELIQGVNISLGSLDVTACEAMDGNSNGTVEINELIRAVNVALAGGCDVPTPEPTATAVPTPEPVAVSCVLGEDSSLTLSTALFPIQLDEVGGELSIECQGGAAATSGLSGDASCSCSVESFDAVNIPGIGDACIAPFSPCPDRVLTCDGGPSLDADVVGDHNIGECTGASDCSSQCDTYCGGLGDGYIRQFSTCEDFCIGGDNDGATCAVDADCPGGSCGGPDGGADGPICECVCVEPGRGAAAPAGGLSCSLGVSITVELDQDGICGNIAPSITLDPLCGELTTGTSEGIILNATNAPGVEIGPQVLTGNPVSSCSDFASGNVTGLNLVGHLSFFGSAVGDLLVDNNFVCE